MVVALEDAVVVAVVVVAVAAVVAVVSTARRKDRQTLLLVSHSTGKTVPEYAANVSVLQ